MFRANFPVLGLQLITQVSVSNSLQELAKKRKNKKMCEKHVRFF